MILLQLFKVLCVCNTRVGQIRAGQIRVGQIRAHHCSEYTIADQPSIVLAAKVSFCPKYPRSSAFVNARVGRIRAGQIRVGHTRAHHCCEYTIADQPSIVLAAKVSFCPKYPRSSAFVNARVGRIRAGHIRVGHIRAHHCSECSNLKKQRQPSALQPQKYTSPP